MAKKLQLRRGTTSQHSSFTGAVGEVTVDTDKDVVVVHDGSTAGGHPMIKASAAAELIDEDNFSSDSATKAPSQQSTKAYIAATSQPLDADLTSLAGCQSGAAAAIAALTQAEVEILDGATVTTAELNTLDGFTGDKDDLIYAKDLKATGVTATEYDYLDGVTSAIQTQLDAKGVGDMTLAGTQTVTGLKNFNLTVGPQTAVTHSSNGTYTCALGTTNNHKVTISADCQIDFSGATNAGQSGIIEVVYTSGAVTWSNKNYFAGGTSNAPTITGTTILAYLVFDTNKVLIEGMSDVKNT